MEFEWDEAKRQANLAKHGLDFADLAAIDWASVKYKPDLRMNYGETRFQAFVLLESELHQVTFTHRGSAIRILSFRRASRRERKAHDP